MKCPSAPLACLLVALAQVGGEDSDTTVTGCGCSGGIGRDSVTAEWNGGEAGESTFSTLNSESSSITESNSKVVVDVHDDGGPPGMILVERSEFSFGTDKPAIIPDGEGPSRTTELSSYYIDRYMVTNQDYQEFVEDTSYKTDSEKYGWSFVFILMLSEEQKRTIPEAVAGMDWWLPVRGAFWREPEGPKTNVFQDGRAKHPVTHVSWNDADAYCRWREGRLPSEAEWERAVQGEVGGAEGEAGGKRVPFYPWGDELTPGGQHRANVWQGRFPAINTGEDGFRFTSPVDAFPAQNSLGLRDPIGNAWEWVNDWWTPDRSDYPRVDPQGPATGIEKTKKGGSFLCHHTYCFRYRAAARTKTDVDSGTSNQGFRCAADVPSKQKASGGQGSGSSGDETMREL